MSRVQHSWRRLVAIVGLTALLIACSAPLAELTAPASVPSPAEQAAPAPGEAYRLTELSFAGNGDTFLAAIDAAAPRAVEHQFIELADGAGNSWQGELLNVETEAILFLQPAQRGGATAVRIDGPAPLDLAAAAALLPDVSGGTLASPHPEIRFVRAIQGDESWRFDVTLAYPDIGWEDYADGWHVATPDGAIRGTRVLLHPHVNEQPFTRSLSGVLIVPDSEVVVIRSHDLVSGYSPETLRIPLTAPVATDRYEVVRN